MLKYIYFPEPGTSFLEYGITKIFNEITRRPVENPVAHVLQEGVVVGLANHTILISKDGKERPIDDSAAPIRGDKEECLLITDQSTVDSLQ